MNDDSDTSADEDAELLEYHFDLFVGDHVQLHERMRDVVAQISESKNTIDTVIKRGLVDVRLGVGYDHVESVRELEEECNLTTWLDTVHSLPGLDASDALRAFLVEHNNRKSTIPDSILTGFRECSNNPGARVQFFEELWNAVFTDPMNNGEISTLKAKVLPIFTLAQYPLKTSVYEAYGEIRGVIH